MVKLLEESRLAERAFFSRQGFPNYRAADESGGAHPAHRAWVKCVESEGPAYNSPMARKMFVLGWLQAKKEVQGG